MDLDRKIHTRFGEGFVSKGEEGMALRGISGAFLESGLMAKKGRSLTDHLEADMINKNE